MEDEPTILMSSFEKRLATISWKHKQEVPEAFSLSRNDLLELAPIIQEIKTEDGEIV